MFKAISSGVRKAKVICKGNWITVQKCGGNLGSTETTNAGTNNQMDMEHQV
jgi:hypothetical protein